MLSLNLAKIPNAELLFPDYLTNVPRYCIILESLKELVVTIYILNALCRATQPEISYNTLAHTRIMANSRTTDVFAGC